MHWSRLYYQYIPDGKEYPVLCRRMDTGETGWLKTVLNYMNGEFESEQILLDWNEIAEQYGSFLSYAVFLSRSLLCS